MHHALRSLAPVLAVTACLLGAPAWAAPPAAPDPTGVAYLVGRWAATAEDPQTGEVLNVDYRVEPAPGGAWLMGAGVSTDGSINARDVWGRDPQTGEIMRLIFDSAGTFGTIRSRGWTGDTLVLEGEAKSSGGVLRVRETITRLGPDRFRAVWEAHRDGKWVVYSVELLSRV